MIDTIIIRIHDLEKYALLIKRLDLKREPGIKVFSAKTENGALKKVGNMGFNTFKETLDVVELTGRGEYLIKRQKSKITNASNHYDLTYFIDYTKNYIEFNFSIPKYKYGTNVLMFVEHNRDKDFRLYENSTLEYNIHKAPARLRGFIKGFIKREFILTDVDLKDVEINRIDVCFNQIFKSKKDALDYLNYQMNVTKKHSRENDGGKANWDTSFMYTTKRSSSKIYHKGTEYKKHDFKEHLKINQKKGLQYFDTENIQALADRTLRYELTIRSAELNYIFRHNIFRKDCPIYQRDHKLYLKVKNTNKQNERIAKKIAELPKEQKNEYRKLYPYKFISKEDKLIYKSVSNLIERKPLFMMDINDLDEEYNLKTTNRSCNKAKFSQELISLCLKKLMKFIEEFKIKELPDEEKVSKLIDDYNGKHNKKFLKADMMQFYLLLVKHRSFKEANTAARYSKATLYRYKERFKKIGITENHVQPNCDFTIPNPPLDLKEYHAYLMNNKTVSKI